MAEARLRARQLLAEMLAEWELNWLQWPASALAGKLSQAPFPWFDLGGRGSDWVQRLLTLWHLKGDPEQPLILVLEPPEDLELLWALKTLAQRQALPRVVILLLDWAAWLAPVSAAGHWFQRSSEPPAWAWSQQLRSWELDFCGSLSLEEPHKISERLEQVLGSGDWRLLHLYGPSQSLPRIPQRRRKMLSAPDSLEMAFFERLSQWLPRQNCPIWASSAQPPKGLPWLICPPELACGAAWTAQRAGTFPLVVLSAAELGQALGPMLQGLPPNSLWLLSETGLCWQQEEEHLAPSRLRDLALLRQVHGLALSCPADLSEAGQLVKLSSESESPLALRLSQAPAVQTGLGNSPPLPGRSQCLRQGQHAAILALGPMVYAALLASESLAAWGIECQVWDARFLKPLDWEALEEACQTGHLLTVEEHCLQGGLATMTLETLSQLGRWPKLAHLALPSTPPIARGTPAEAFGLDADGIQRALRELLGVAKPPS